MDEQKLADIEARAKAGDYGTMCKACSDRLSEAIAHIRELESQNKDLVNRLADFTSGDYT